MPTTHALRVMASSKILQFSIPCSSSNSSIQSIFAGSIPHLTSNSPLLSLVIYTAVELLKRAITEGSKRCSASCTFTERLSIVSCGSIVTRA